MPVPPTMPRQRMKRPPRSRLMRMMPRIGLSWIGLNMRRPRRTRPIMHRPLGPLRTIMRRLLRPMRTMLLFVPVRRRPRRNLLRR